MEPKRRQYFLAGGLCVVLLIALYRLKWLDAERPTPGAAKRNLFRFKSPPPTPPASPFVPGPTTVPGPAPAAAQAPIALKFIGSVEEPEQSQKIAVLSDGRNVFYGAEADIIEGRFRILRIGAEWVEIAYLDGGGRHTLRLTGE